MNRIYRIFLVLVVLMVVGASKPSTASPEKVTTEFFQYLLTSQREITSDSPAQERWMSEALRSELVKAMEAAKRKALERRGEKIDLPSNDTFLAAWEKPASFKIISSQKTPFTALAAVEFLWSAQSEYPGDKRTMTTVLVYENTGWRISDIHVHKGKYTDNRSVLADLRQTSLK